VIWTSDVTTWPVITFIRTDRKFSN
jgi:hypothetical protein